MAECRKDLGNRVFLERRRQKRSGCAVNLTGVAAQGLANYIDVRSYVFEVKVEAEINGYKRNYYGIVSRAGASGQKMLCVKFYWE